MADDAGQPQPDLTSLPVPPIDLGFFELLARLETPGRRFGRAGRAADEPARLGQSIRLAFSTRDVAAYTAGNGDAAPRVDVDIIGLLGPEGPMPLHITRWVMARLSERWFAGGADRATADTAFLDFCNLLQHRMIALYWRAWADARPEVQAPQGSGGRARATLAALAGLGLPGTGGRGDGAALGPLKTAQATSLGQEVRSPERLTGFLAEMLGVPVALSEFVGDWTDIPAGLQTGLGRAHAALGQSAVIGRRVFQRQNRAELKIGPLDLATYTALIEDDGLRDRLTHAILFVSGQEITFDLRLVLRADAVPAPRLGAGRLGRTIWSGDTTTDRDDLRIRNIAGGLATGRVAA